MTASYDFTIQAARRPTSILTRLRPDIWQRALCLATDLTGLTYLPKVPMADGTICACGGGVYDGPPTPAPDPFCHESDLRERLRKLREQREKEVHDGSTPHFPSQWDRWIRDVEKQIHDTDPEAVRREEVKRREREKKEQTERLDRKIVDLEESIQQKRGDIGDLEERLRERRAEREALDASATISVPDGAVEWLLHEVGHWLGATPEERRLPNYWLTDDITGVVNGFQKILIPHDFRAEREWQAWAFQEIVLAPWGPSRLFVPPTQADGVAFEKAGPIPAWALRHAERQMRASGVDVDAWRAVVGEWVQFERVLAVPSWERVN